MRTFRGVAANISESILGKVISEATSLGSGVSDSFVFLFEDPQKGTIRSGVLLGDKTSMPEDGNYPLFKLLAPDYPIAIGDIFLIEPSGLGTVLYEKNSRSNAVILTERCNCHCLTCPQPPQTDQGNLVDFALRIIPFMDPDTEALGITGGEPTLVWEGLLKVIAASRQYLPNTYLQLLTNARVLKDYDKVEELAKTAQGKLLVCVPLYGDVDDLHDQIVGAKGAFWDTVEGLFNLARAGIPVELRTVVVKPNYFRLAKWSEFVYRTFPFAAHVAFMGMEPIGLAAKNIDMLWVDPIDYVSQLEKAVRLLHRRDMQVSIYNHQLCTLPEDLWPFARKSISEWKIIYASECDDCIMKSACGGFFQSAQSYRSRAITSLDLATKDGAGVSDNTR